MAAGDNKFPLSIGSTIQCIVLSIVGYMLAGAPLLSMLTGDANLSASQAPPEIHPDKLSTLVIPEANLSCESHAYKGVHVLSREPLVVYIEGFLDNDEASHIVDIRYVILALFRWFYSSQSALRSNLASCCLACVQLVGLGGPTNATS